jgi:hypothetical protein
MKPPKVRFSNWESGVAANCAAFDELVDKPHGYASL